MAQLPGPVELKALLAHLKSEAEGGGSFSSDWETDRKILIACIALGAGSWANKRLDEIEFNIAENADDAYDSLRLYAEIASKSGHSEREEAKKALVPVIKYVLEDEDDYDKKTVDLAKRLAPIYAPSKRGRI